MIFILLKRMNYLIQRMFILFLLINWQRICVIRLRLRMSMRYDLIGSKIILLTL